LFKFFFFSIGITIIPNTTVATTIISLLNGAIGDLMTIGIKDSLPQSKITLPNLENPPQIGIVDNSNHIYKAQ